VKVLDTILIFQGGGSLGAYECGVYQALSRWFREKGHRLAVVAGTSMGAVNAAIIATHSADSDQGVAALQNFWHSVAQNSVCFLPPFGELAAWNAVWTSLLFGGRGVFRPSVPLWTFMPPVTWAPFTKFYDTTVLESTLEGFFHEFGPNRAEPRLIVTAVDIDRIKPVTFDSWDTAITPRHIRASCSLPPGFGATELDQLRLWDGGLWSNTPLREVLNCLQKRNAPKPEATSEHLVFIVDLFAPGTNGQVQTMSNWDIWGLRDRVLFQDKGEYDERSADWVNRHIDFVREVRRHIHALPAPERSRLDDLSAFVERTANRMEEEGRIRLNIRRIVRSDGNRHEVSREIDFSPARIAALMNQGEADTTALIATL
jgi:NTE family protein